MDASEADRLTREFAQHVTRQRRVEPVVSPHWSSATIWTLVALIAAAFTVGLATAFS